MASYALPFGVSLAISLALTLLVSAVARRFGFVAKPRADRWHKKPTALFGGVAMYVAFAATALALRLHDIEGDMLLLACASGMFVLGFVDDLVQLKPYAKLVGQIVIAAIFTTFGLRLHWLPSPPLDQLLTIFWLVGITNAVNLLDSLDGVAGGIAAIAAAFLVYFCHSSGQSGAAWLAAAFCGAVLGFLVFNFNPASIFMGDCGSLFLGFFLGGIVLVNNQVGTRRNLLAVLTIPVLLLLIPILDTTLVTVTRKFHGRPISQGGRDHTAHRLVALGLSERAAALVLYGLAAVSGLVGVMVKSLSMAVALGIVPAFGAAVLFLLIFVGKVKVYKPVDGPLDGTGEGAGGKALLPTLADFTYKRRIFEVLNDLLIVTLAYYGSYLVRFDGQILEPHYTAMLNSLPVVIVVQLGAMLSLGLYRGLWRYTSMSDLVVQLRAVGGAWVLSVVSGIFLFRFEGLSRGMFLVDLLLLIIGIAGTRVALRVLRTWAARLQPAPDSRRILIYGAGDGGELLVRELLQNRDLNMTPIGFLDDDPTKEGRVIHGVQVYGSIEKLGTLTSAQQVDEVLVSSSKIAAERLAQLNAECQSRGVAFRKMRITFE